MPHTVKRAFPDVCSVCAAAALYCGMIVHHVTVIDTHVCSLELRTLSTCCSVFSDVDVAIYWLNNMPFYIKNHVLNHKQAAFYFSLSWIGST